MTVDLLPMVRELIGPEQPFALLTGAGCSTGSGIPGYRDRNGDWKHAKPVMFDDFMKHHSTRQRYWARTTVGWQRMAQAQPGLAHTAISELQAEGRINRVVTQNVDGLHQKAGTRDVIDLHGRLDEVRCQQCQLLMPRADWQSTVIALNQDWLDQIGVVVEKPDGDALIEGADYDGFVVPDCPRCGGIVKPEVVFFGESVPRDRVDAAYRAVAEAQALVVAGSSLMVFSGFRFAKRCAELGKPLVIINRGKTRADDIATIKIDADVGESLQGLVGR